ncbi:hypothetical protein [Streptomyces sp. NRRL S-31]|uniref:hypothetical protein n=1 Tax=Streptomyces sp. NRRL S-31 TaxID=1463898 RepID=UPI0004CBCA70|nr:hypothetical protein [Streptomyces sp. NRRL S-31]
MDSELAALAASGATTLVSLMATDSWTHARELVGRFLARTGSDTTAIADLDDARSRLLDDDTGADEQVITDVRTHWQVRLRRHVEAGSATDGELRALVASFQRLAAAPVTSRDTVHNDIHGGVQHGPVIQAGRITGLTLHVNRPPASDQG